MSERGHDFEVAPWSVVFGGRGRTTRGFPGPSLWERIRDPTIGGVPLPLGSQARWLAWLRGDFRG